MPDITKPTAGQPGWNTAMDALIDQANLTPVYRVWSSSTGWPARGVPTTHPVIWVGPDTSPPPIGATGAYDGSDSLDEWHQRVTS